MSLKMTIIAATVYLWHFMLLNHCFILSHLLSSDLTIYTYITCISYNMGKSALPDMYARSPRVAGPRAEGIHIRQSTSAHVITNMLHFWHS